MKKGAVTKGKSRMMTIWVPLELFPALDQAVVTEDTDRSKYVRRAIREKLARSGITVEAT